MALSIDKKKTLGQFFTTEYEYILQNMSIPDEVTTIIEPFAGNGDLLSFVKNRSRYRIKQYDIDPQNEQVERRNTLADPPTYQGAFIITNPPYLARNKSPCKLMFDKFAVNDLYKCFIVDLLTNQCVGGILIVPLNFWCSIRAMDIELRRSFLSTYSVIHLNIFEERVFADTSYTVCSFQFSLRRDTDPMCFNVSIYPGSQHRFSAVLDDENNFTFGGDIYNLPSQEIFKVSRLVKGGTPNTNILVKCIDDSATSQISMRIVSDDDMFYDDTPRQSARTYATLIITPIITLPKQEKLVADFNQYIQQHREKHHSLFLSNYRESKSIARKRISFDLVYKLVGHLLNT